MAAIDHSAYAPTPVSTLTDPTEILRGFLRSIRTYIAYRQTRESLDRLSPRQLEDIGLDGTDIDTLAWKMAKKINR